MWRALRWWGWLLIGLLLLPGCVATVSTRMNVWGWGKRTIEIPVMPAGNAKAVQALLREKLGRFYKVYAREIGADKKIVTAARRFRGPERLGDATLKVGPAEGSLGRVFRRRLEYTETLRLDTLLPSADERELAKNITLRYRLRLPGRFVQQATNANRIENGWAVWEFALAEAAQAEGKTIRAVSLRLNYFTTFIALLLLATLLLFLLPAGWQYLKSHPLTLEEKEKRRLEGEERKRQRELAQEEKRRRAEERQRQQEAEKEERARQAEARRQQQALERERQQREAEERRRQREIEQERRRQEKQARRRKGSATQAEEPAPKGALSSEEAPTQE